MKFAFLVLDQTYDIFSLEPLQNPTRRFDRLLIKLCSFHRPDIFIILLLLSWTETRMHKEF